MQPLWHVSAEGATAVEFALVAFPFFYVLGAICETGLMLFTEYVVQNAVQEAARTVRTGQVSTTSGTATKTESEFKDSICADLSTLIDCDGELTVYVNNAADFAALEGAIEDPVNIGKQIGRQLLDHRVPARRPEGRGNGHRHL